MYNMGEKRTYKDRRDYLISAVAKRRKKIRLKSIKHMGGKCERCGYSKYPEVLEFHHKDPAQKYFNVSEKGHSRSWDRVKKEIEKCVLLCANCHRENHVESKLAASKGNVGMNSE
jgi:5-methylcytosine-specific restriction endonuclease McrA